MAIEDEARKIAEAAESDATLTAEREALMDRADRVAVLIGRYAHDLGGLDVAAISPEIRRDLIMQAGANAWHAELCHGSACNDGAEAE